ncbi:TetR family transcriptional regulator [Sinomonas atrocyanea]|uniref:TetR family transcriptional regulator n=1 Tax=Sinomonas atrocyanea TaxID=37927 RepID=A0A127A2Q8_9MICC|nr:TetR family transcriptional regulator C-terminal domain-containing protein [Sinomonas atrocyanea]AMM33396.1 TetR family transcriptional regulator [Sinomonas atrocyanea]GEB62840.1 TetR family transcriptional regulator [Sinomonas atrocyanea]GGG60467.1 TetR family transcriptional regulator [Sinomonas atrocyanea]
MPRNVDAALRRQEIVEAVKRIVIADGLGRVSLREVAAEAGLVVGSVRHYFGSSAELAAHAFDAVTDSVLGRLEAAGAAAHGTAEDGCVAQLCQLLPLDEARAVDLCVWTEFKLAARTRPELEPPAERSHRAVAAALGRALVRLCPALAQEDLVREAERLLATVEGLGLHAMLHGRWLDADLCTEVVRAQVASVGLAGAGAAGAAAGIH